MTAKDRVANLITRYPNLEILSDLQRHPLSLHLRGSLVVRLVILILAVHALLRLALHLRTLISTSSPVSFGWLSLLLPQPIRRTVPTPRTFLQIRTSAYTAPLFAVKSPTAFSAGLTRSGCVEPS